MHNEPQRARGALFASALLRPLKRLCRERFSLRAVACGVRRASWRRGARLRKLTSPVVGCGAHVAGSFAPVVRWCSSWQAGFAHRVPWGLATHARQACAFSRGAQLHKFASPPNGASHRLSRRLQCRCARERKRNWSAMNRDAPRRRLWCQAHLAGFLSGSGRILHISSVVGLG